MSLWNHVEFFAHQSRSAFCLVHEMFWNGRLEKLKNHDMSMLRERKREDYSLFRMSWIMISIVSQTHVQIRRETS